MKSCLFLVSGHLQICTGTTELSSFRGAGRKAFPWTMVAFTLAALSMIGIPPLAGFFSKWYLVLAAIEGQSWGYLLIILLGSLLTAIYFFRVLEIIYLAPPTPAGIGHKAKHGNGWVPGKSEGYETLIPILTLAGGLILLGILNAPIVAVVRKMLPPGME
jgi:multicomponent Na+:H+ antiporter subunit D